VRPSDRHALPDGHLLVHRFPAPSLPVPIHWVLIRDARGVFPTQALLCTDLDATPLQILSWFMLRWQPAVTFQEVRAHLGVETQRETVAARNSTHDPGAAGPLLGGHAVDAFTAVTPQEYHSPGCMVYQNRARLRRCPGPCTAAPVGAGHFSEAPCSTESIHLPRVLLERLHELLCYEA
jgi:hypothetical protein